MKRSEMLNILKEEFTKYDTAGSAEDHKLLAEHILSVIELFDMQPPVPTGRLNYGSYYWEPEDE